MIVRKLIDSIFNTDIQFVICPVAEIRAWLADQADFEDNDSAEEWARSNAVTLQSAHGTARWLVWLHPMRDQDTTQLGTLVHECLHVTAQVLGDRGVVLCPESEEVFAYYQTAVFEQLLEVLRSARASSTTKKMRVRGQSSKTRETARLA